MSQHRFSILYDFGDMLAATWLTVRRRWLWGGAARYVAILSLVMFVILELPASEHSGVSVIANAIGAILISAACLGVTFLFFRWSVPRSVRKSYEQLGLEGGTIEFLFDDDQLEIADATNTLTLPWDRWIRWAENDRVLLLFRTDACAHYVPKSQVEPDVIASLVEHLELAGVRKT